jgi:tRNA (adenine37-N6)-methyltransferase
MNIGMTINPIGQVNESDGIFSIRLDGKYVPGLKCLDGFSHLVVVWWGDRFDDPEHRSILINEKPYRKGPEKIGVFATRSQLRPNPILLTTINIMKIDHEKGIIFTPYIDAADGSPVLDIKPYHMMERIRSCKVPEWCGHWPGWYEDCGTFNWQDEFNF